MKNHVAKTPGLSLKTLGLFEYEGKGVGLRRGFENQDRGWGGVYLTGGRKGG